MSELEDYKEQLKAVEESLHADPENASLKELQKELNDLIELLSESPSTTQKNQEEQLPPPQKSQPNTSTTPSQEPSTIHEVGDVVFAKPNLENLYKEAKITNISGNFKTFTVQFLESGIIETYQADQIHKEKPKDLVSKYKKQQQRQQQEPQKKQAPDEEELNKTVQSWKNFSKKKGVLKKKSQFKTIDQVASMSVKKKEKNLHRYNPY